MRDQNANNEMDELIRRSAQVEIPAEVEDRLRHRLAEFRTRVEQRPPNRWRSLAYTLTYRPPLRAMAMTAAALVAVAVGLVLIPREANANRVYAAAAQQLRSSQSLEYTFVFSELPYVGVDFSYAAPGYQRVNCSWGIEVRADHTARKQIVLMHLTRMYVVESGKQVESPANSDDWVKQLESLPPVADQVLGERQAGGKRLIGYRLVKAPDGTSIPGLKSFDLWVDAGTRQADHVDIAIEEQGKPVYRMHIRNIRVDGPIDRSLFDLTPPAGYTAITAPGVELHGNKPAPVQNALVLQAQILQSTAMTAVMAPMTGILRASSRGSSGGRVLPEDTGRNSHRPSLWTFRVRAQLGCRLSRAAGNARRGPFRFESLPPALVASVVVNGAWGTDSDARWGAFLKSVVEQGYVPAGPPMEMWSGEDAKPGTQSTEMSIPVTKAN